MFNFVQFCPILFNLEARNVIKHIKDLSERFTPTVAVVSAVLPITNNLITKFALPSKDKLIRTAARARKQLDVNMPPIPVARNFEIPEFFENFIRYDSGSNDHERIIQSSGEVIFLVDQ